MIEVFEKIELLLPWEKCSGGLETELRNEVSPDHFLYGVEAVSLARRIDNDDVLFFLPAHEKPLAVVHLTWSGKQDAHSDFPRTILFSSLEDWIENCLKLDHKEFEN